VTRELVAEDVASAFQAFAGSCTGEIRALNRCRLVLN
jgi:hypothetical protein